MRKKQFNKKKLKPGSMNVKKFLSEKWKNNGDLTRNIENYLKEHFEILAFFNFTNLTSMLGKSNTQTLNRLALLNSHITSFKEMSLFSADNISSILSGAGNALASHTQALIVFTTPLRENGALIQDAQGKPFTALSYLMTQGLSAQNISSILSSAGNALASSIQALIAFTTPFLVKDGALILIQDAQSKPFTTLSHLMAQGLSAQNISSILSGAGNALASRIQALIAFTTPFLGKDDAWILIQKDGALILSQNAQGKPFTTLSHLITQGFSAKNISSILSSAGNTLASSGIQALITFTTPLLGKDGALIQDAQGKPVTTLSHLMAQGLSAQNISSSLSSARNALASSIQALRASNTPLPHSTENISLFPRIRDSKDLRETTEPLVKKARYSLTVS